MQLHFLTWRDRSEADCMKRALANWNYLPIVKVGVWLKNEHSEQCISWLTFFFQSEKKLSHVSSKYRNNFHYTTEDCFTDLQRHLSLSIDSTGNFMKLVHSRQNFGITEIFKLSRLDHSLHWYFTVFKIFAFSSFLNIPSRSLRENGDFLFSYVK